MKDKKLFLFDLDGTLLTSRKEISPRTYQALEDFTAAGNIFAVCTGRALESVLDIQSKYRLNFPGTYLVCFNGAQIYDCSARRTILKTGVPLSMVPDIMNMARERGIQCQTYTDDYIVSQDYNEALVYYRIDNHTPVIITDNVMKELSEAPSKLIAIDMYHHDRLESLRQAIDEKYGSELTTIFSSSVYLEIFHNTAGKGKALIWLSEHLGIPRENTLAAGDAENDISMVEEAGTGIAMCNGSAEIRAAADRITEKDNDHDGLVPFLRGEF